MMKMTQVRKNIIREATALFKRYGIRTVRVDAISATLHISKRTLYELFPSKQKLLEQCMMEEIGHVKKLVGAMEGCCLSPLERIVQMDRVLLSQALSFCPAFFCDFRKEKEVWSAVNEELKAWCFETVMAYCHQAMCDGIIASDCNIRFVLEFLGNNLWHSYTFRNLSAGEAPDIHVYTTLTFLSGLCTDQGREMLRTYRQQNFHI